jgi:hypothetical protein
LVGIIACSPAIKSNNSQMLSPPIRRLHILEKCTKVFTLTLSLLKLNRHNACDNIIAMLEHLPC